MLGRTGLLAAIAALLLAACASAPRSGGYTFTPRLCPFGDAPGAAECGSVSVPEDYARPSGRRIELFVVRLRALEPGPRPQAMFEFDGGPGFAATDFASDYWTHLAPLRQHTDIVLFDMRGTGRSNALLCTAIEAYRSNDRNAPLYPPELVEECSEEVAAHATPRHYTTENAARDVDAVRAALGYNRINVAGGSYGSTLALAYMTLYPERVRSAFLFGIAPASARPPRAHAIAAQRALEMYIRACQDEPACNTAFPDLAGDLGRIRIRLAAPDAPFPFEIFMERLRERMYGPAPARRLPLVIHRAAQGDFEGFMSAPPGGAGRVLADGLYLSITCAESFPFFDYDEAAGLARETYFNDYRLRRQRDACAHWPVQPARTPGPSTPLDIPTVLVSGDFDPATPPNWARDIRSALNDSRHILIAEGGHGLGGLTNLECLLQIQAAFLENPNPTALDTDCIATMRRPPFELE